jgi:hypothetical protein
VKKEVSLKQILLISLLIFSFACTKKSEDSKDASKKLVVPTDVDRYCSFAKELISDPKYKKNPILHLKKFQEFRAGGISKNFGAVLMFLSKTPKPKRYEILVKAARKITKNDNWDCPEYKTYVEKF